MWHVFVIPALLQTHFMMTRSVAPHAFLSSTCRVLIVMCIYGYVELLPPSPLTLTQSLLLKNRDGWGIETKDADQITRVFQWIDTACLCFSADVFNPNPNPNPNPIT